MFQLRYSTLNILNHETDEAEEASGAGLPPPEGPGVPGAVPGVFGAGEGVGPAEEGVHANLHKVQTRRGRPPSPV